MKLTALRLHNVRRFGGRGVAIENIGDGVNVLCAANEQGKSTCFEALHALFFQPHSGTPGVVQMLRPYSGGSPLVEADIVTVDGAFRLTKQFYAGKRASVTDLGSGRLVAQADEAESFIANLVRGGTAGPAGLLWVRQGITGIEKKTKSEADEEKRAREDVLSSVQGEVEALTGGRRMSEVSAACEDELAILVTATGRPKAGGPYAAALARRDELIATEQRLEADVRELREALDARRKARSRLAELESPDEAAVRRTATADTEKALGLARSHHEKLRVAEAEADLARVRHDGSRRALDAYRLARSREAELRSKREIALLVRADAIERQRAASMEAETAFTTVEAAERLERDARELLVRLQRALRSRETAEALAGLRDRLGKAEAARQQVEDGDAALRAIAVPAEALRSLESLETEIVGLRAAEAARRPTLRIDYTEGAPVTIFKDGVALRGGEDIAIGDVARLELPGIGALTIRSARDVAEEGSLPTAEAKRRALLVSLGVDSLAQARERHLAAITQAADLELVKRQFAQLAPQGIAPLREAIARLDNEPQGDIELKGDPEQAEQARLAADQYLASARETARATRPAREHADKAVAEAEKALSAIDIELAGLVSTPDEEAVLTGAYLATEEQLAAKATHVDALRFKAPDIASMEAAWRRAKSVQDEATTEIGRLREQLADLTGRIRTRTDDAVEEAWQEAVDARAAAENDVRRLESEVAVLTRLRTALATARTAARDLYIAPVMRELRPLLGLLFDDASITFDETTLLPLSVRRNGQDEEVERLSGGMREQLSVLTRLAFARLLANSGRPAPVVLDDALVYSDDDRIEKMFDALHRQSRDQQIIIFSCRQRAFAKLGGNILRMTEWKPA